MRLAEYLLNGGTLFDVTVTWPAWLTSTLRDNVEAMALDYSLRRIQPRVQVLAEMMDTDIEDVIHLQVLNRIKRNDYKYRTLLATEAFQYNPIENYNMVEEGSETFAKGSQEDATVYGQDQTSTLHGHTLTRTHADTDTQTLNNTDTRTHANSDTRTLADSDTLTLNTSDARTSSAEIDGATGATEGARTDTTGRTVYGYNSSTGAPAEDTTATKGSQTNSGTSHSESTGADTLLRTGTETTAHSGTITDAHAGTIADAHTGTITNGHTGTITDANSGTDQVTRAARTDTRTEGEREDARTHTLTRSGNIGVTTSQQMIEAERAVAEFSFLSVLTADLVNSFCLGVM